MIEVVVCTKRAFYLPDAARQRFKELVNAEISKKVLRTNPYLIQTVRELGGEAEGIGLLSETPSVLQVVSVPETAYYVVYPYGEVVYDNLEDALEETWDSCLDIVSFATNSEVAYEQKQ